MIKKITQRGLALLLVAILLACTIGDAKEAYAHVHTADCYCDGTISELTDIEAVDSTCTKCNGTGIVQCEYCKGTGKITNVSTHVHDDSCYGYTSIYEMVDALYAGAGWTNLYKSFRDSLKNVKGHIYKSNDDTESVYDAGYNDWDIMELGAAVVLRQDDVLTMAAEIISNYNFEDYQYEFNSTSGSPGLATMNVYIGKGTSPSTQISSGMSNKFYYANSYNLQQEEWQDGCYDAASQKVEYYDWYKETTKYKTGITYISKQNITSSGYYAFGDMTVRTNLLYVARAGKLTCTLNGSNIEQLNYIKLSAGSSSRKKYDGCYYDIAGEGLAVKVERRALTCTKSTNTTTVNCSNCSGKGKLTCTVCSGNGHAFVCKECNGLKYTYTECLTCGGTGEIYTEKKI